MPGPSLLAGSARLCIPYAPAGCVSERMTSAASQTLLAIHLSVAVRLQPAGESSVLLPNSWCLRMSSYPHQSGETQRGSTTYARTQGPAARLARCKRKSRACIAPVRIPGPPPCATTPPLARSPAARLARCCRATQGCIPPVRLPDPPPCDTTPSLVRSPAEHPAHWRTRTRG